MKWVGRIISSSCFLVLCLHAAGTEALAAEGDWRPVYDLVMRWVNFLILAFLLFKFGRTPLMNFLKGQRYDLSREIDELTEKKTAAEARLEEIQTALAASNAHFQEITERIVRQGERRKAEIIADARQEGKILLEGAKQKVDSQFIQAKDQLRAELVDTAIDMVLERLPAEVGEADSQRMVDNYLQKALAG